ncbi:MAG: TIGR02444 family protein [Parvularcula sp.]
MTVPLADSFWRWAEAHYGAAVVREELHTLQDRYGYISVCVLWAIWAAHQGFRLTTSEAKTIVGTVVDMDRYATYPLRSVRRFLSAPQMGFSATHQADVRQKVLNTEIETERLVMSALADLTDAAASGRFPPATAADARGEARRYFAVCGCYLETPRLLVDEEGPDSASTVFDRLVEAIGSAEAKI